MPYYRAELGGNPPYEEGQGLDLTDSTLSLNAASTSEYGGAKVDGETIGINSQGQLFALKQQIITLSATTSSIGIGDTDTITATASGGGTISATSNDTDVATVSVSNGEITITGVSAGTTTITVTASSVGLYGPAEAVISVEIITARIYGAEWDGSSSSAWTRTDDAASFTDPNPYYSGMNGTPSSPFDNISPWKDIRIVNDSSAGTLVEIPKFYYKWTFNKNSMKLQISTVQEEGFLCSPAHSDRGDNVGERDYVYIGRYHCASGTTSYSADNYKSTSGKTPKVKTTIANFRSDIHNLGSNVWQNDFAMFWTVRMLYLVEFANWNSQSCIGYGCGDGSAVSNMGYTDSMPYHTGTTQSSRTTYGYGTQYRYIEGLWDNVLDCVDGIYFGGSSATSVYEIKNPSNFSTGSGSENICTRSSIIGGFIKGWIGNINNVAGFEYSLYPYPDGNITSGTYICDYVTYGNLGIILRVGGSYSKSLRSGLFYFDNGLTTSTGNDYGSRLMVLPPSRLSPPTD